MTSIFLHGFSLGRPSAHRSAAIDQRAALPLPPETQHSRHATIAYRVLAVKQEMQTTCFVIGNHITGPAGGQFHERLPASIFHADVANSKTTGSLSLG
jgi:hypothetical protein